MRTFLSHDEASGELRLVMTDLWDGQHERTEFRVVSDEGRPIRKGQNFDGLTAYRDAFGGWYAKVGPSLREARFAVEKLAVREAKTQCRRLASKSGRAKCALCADL
jgi:hypothetical protein